MIKNLMKSIEAKDERDSWNVETESCWRLNVIIDGMGLSREFPVLEERGRFDSGMGQTEDEVMAMVATAKRKGLKPTLHRFDRTVTRLV